MTENNRVQVDENSKTQVEFVLSKHLENQENQENQENPKPKTKKSSKPSIYEN